LRHLGTGAYCRHDPGAVVDSASQPALIGHRLTQTGTRIAGSGYVPLFLGGPGLIGGIRQLDFLPAATSYYPNEFFWNKLILLALALTVHVTAYRKIAYTEQVNPLAGRVTAVLSLGLWFSVAFAGRFIGFF
jgi:hypothetical protein